MLLTLLLAALIDELSSSSRFLRNTTLRIEMETKFIQFGIAMEQELIHLILERDERISRIVYTYDGLSPQSPTANFC